MLQIYDKNFLTLDAKGMDEFLTGAQNSMEQKGWKFQSKKHERCYKSLQRSSTNC